MRVLHVSDRLNTRGGAQRYLLDLLAAQTLGLMGDCAPHLAVAADDGDAGRPCALTYVPGLDARGRDDSCLAALQELATRLRPDLVHLHTVVNPAVLEWATAWPTLATVQDHRAFCPGRGKWTLDERVCRTSASWEVCRSCFEDAAYFDAIATLTDARLRALRALELAVLSRYMRAELIALGCPAGRVHVTPPWAPAAEVGTADDGPRLVLFAGRLAASKGVADAVAAWRRAQIDLPLVFAGTGPLRATLEREGFEVLGWLEHARLLAVMRRAAALLMPSRWQEPFGIVGLEALSRGVPVVAWDSGGIAEWHPGPLASWGDVPALAELLRQALRSPARSATRAGFTRDDGLRALGHAYRAVRARAAAGATVKGPG